MPALKSIDVAERAAAAALTDAELASSAVAGSVVSFETLVRRHNRPSGRKCACCCRR